MKLTPDISENDKTSKPTMDMVQQEKQEYKLIGKYLRTRGLRLFAYTPTTKEWCEVEITRDNTLQIVPDETETELIAKDTGMEEAVVHSADIHFEALNLKSAARRVEKYQAGKIKELCNLREATGEGIKFW